MPEPYRCGSLVLLLFIALLFAGVRRAFVFTPISLLIILAAIRGARFICFRLRVGRVVTQTDALRRHSVSFQMK